MAAKVALALIFVVAGSGAQAADFAAYSSAQSRLGAVFNAPPQTVVVDGAPLAAPLFPSPSVPGYYGGGGDFGYRNYYGTSPIAIFSRLPYACGFHGYC